MAITYENGIFWNRTSRGDPEVCELKYLSTLPGVGPNQLVITGIAGQRIRIVRGVLHSQSTTSSDFTYLNGSGGSGIFQAFAPPNSIEPLILELDPTGYFETSVGNGLYVTVLVQSLRQNFGYITYTP